MADVQKWAEFDDSDETHFPEGQRGLSCKRVGVLQTLLFERNRILFGVAVRYERKQNDSDGGCWHSGQNEERRIVRGRRERWLCCNELADPVEPLVCLLNTRILPNIRGNTNPKYILCKRKWPIKALPISQTRSWSAREYVYPKQCYEV